MMKIDFEKIKQQYLNDFKVVDSHTHKPWGAYFVIHSGQIDKFITTFFPHLQISTHQKNLSLSPKLLVVLPHKRLSWQYHFRREEFWTVLDGPIGVASSQNDNEPSSPSIYKRGETIYLGEQMRHRLIGLDNVGVVAEIWKHLDENNLSNEDDIVRLQDDFGR